MAEQSLFSDDYAGARKMFCEAAAARGCRVETFTLPGYTGPGGEPLATDVARWARPDATTVLVLVSGVHGAEGPAGSACQTGVLRGLIDVGLEAADGIDVIAVHSLNPFGFAYRRRVNEDNVDINRNFVAHPAAHDDSAYHGIHPYLVPADWSGPAQAAADAALLELAARMGPREVQAAITGGQYTRPDGLFYGGAEPCWSNRTWREIIRSHLVGYRSIAYIDLHTGLGPRAHGEPIFRGRHNDPAARSRARQWYGDALTDSDAGTSSSTPIDGNTARALVEEIPETIALTAITLEFGTEDALTVLRALQADNWLWQRANPESDLRRTEIDRQMRDAFAPSDQAWRDAVVEIGGRTIGAAVAGLGRRLR